MRTTPLLIVLVFLAGCNRPSENLELYMDTIRPAKEAEKVRIGKELIKLKCTISVDTLNALFIEDPDEGVSWMLRCVKQNPRFFAEYERAKPILDALNKIPVIDMPEGTKPPTQ